MGEEEDSVLKASEIVRVLERFHINKYKFFSNFYLGSPRVIEFNDILEYSTLIDELDIEVKREYVNSPCYIHKMKSYYKGWNLHATLYDYEFKRLEKIVNASV